MGWWDSLVVGILQGLTEFLPVSSSGHLVLIQKYLGFKEHNIQLDVVVHLGTLMSVFTIYFQPIIGVAKQTLQALKARSSNPGFDLFLMIALGSVPTAIIGLTLKSTFEGLFSNVQAVGGFFLLTGFILFATKSKGVSEEQKQQDFRDFQAIAKIPWWKALLIGVAQGGAIAPGVSRSGTTIASAILLGVDRKTASLFSFLLSLPAILGATALQLRDVTWTPDYFYFLLIGFLASYVVGLMGLTLLLHFVKRGRLDVFSYYLWILGVLVLIQ